MKTGKLRKGKLKGRTTITIPYTDNNIRQYITIRINEDIDARKLYRGLRKYIKEQFGTNVDKDWLANVPLITNQYDVIQNVTDADVEAFIERIELGQD